MPVSFWLRSGLHWGMDFIYPRCCRWCRCLLPEDAFRNECFCRRCTQAIAPVLPNRCLRCSAPVGPNLETSGGCLHCRRHPGRYRSVISLGPYADELRLACLMCKHSRHPTLVAGLVELLCRRHFETLRSWDCDLVIPVPHHWWDRIWREHPSAVMGERISRELRLPLDRHCLRKVRRTRKQQSLPVSSREANLRKAFRIAAFSRLKGRRILLVDDILTTGITADRCARVLLQAGAARVDVAVLARSLGG